MCMTYNLYSYSLTDAQAKLGLLWRDTKGYPRSSCIRRQSICRKDILEWIGGGRQDMGPVQSVGTGGEVSLILKYMQGE